MNIRLNTVDIGVKECESNRSTHSKRKPGSWFDPSTGGLTMTGI